MPLSDQNSSSDSVTSPSSGVSGNVDCGNGFHFSLNPRTHPTCSPCHHGLVKQGSSVK